MKSAPPYLGGAITCAPTACGRSPPRSPFPSSSGSRAKFTAIRRASCRMSTLLGVRSLRYGENRTTPTVCPPASAPKTISDARPRSKAAGSGVGSLPQPCKVVSCPDHRRAVRVLDLEPVPRRSGFVGRGKPLRHNALQSHRAACRNTSSPLASVCSLSAIPAGTRASSRANRSLRLLSGSGRSTPSNSSRSKAWRMASVTRPRRWRASNTATPSAPQTTASPSSVNDRAFSLAAALAIAG
jgi:hypothetical protein